MSFRFSKQGQDGTFHRPPETTALQLSVSSTHPTPLARSFELTPLQLALTSTEPRPHSNRDLTRDEVNQCPTYNANTSSRKLPSGAGSGHVFAARSVRFYRWRFAETSSVEISQCPQQIP